ncbi:MAG: alpha/beta hydrolase [Clostridiales bacterium]|nr:alpha/beta hydrolase [Clostridiales bacterium]
MKTDELLKLNIGGMLQSVLVMSEDDSNPVLLALHGGPGTPCMTLFQKHNRELAKHFVFVTWDQRGTGRSYNKNIPPQSMNLEQLIRDTHEITDYLKKRFMKEKIYIMGHSFGATLALRVIDRYPEDYRSYFGVSQFVNASANELESYSFALRKATEHKDDKSIAKLKKIGRPVDGLYSGGLKSSLTERAIVSKYKGDMYEKGSSAGLLLSLLFSKEYGGFRFISCLKGIRYSLQKLGVCLEGIDYFVEIPEVSIPVFFFSGKHDYLTPQSILGKYYDSLKAPYKERFIFENSAHSPLWEESELFNEKIIEIAERYETGSISSGAKKRKPDQR